MFKKKHVPTTTKPNRKKTNRPIDEDPQVKLPTLHTDRLLMCFETFLAIDTMILSLDTLCISTSTILLLVEVTPNFV